MRYIVDHDLHIHTQLSLCSGHPEQTKETILKYGIDNGLTTLCLTDHMWGKTRARTRWAARKGVAGERAAKALIRVFNAKFFDNPIHNELTWARWFFPIINTDKTLHVIDGYLQDSIRYLATQKRTNARFAFRYEDMKALGYRPLVHEYYKQRKEAAENDAVLLKSKNEKPCPTTNPTA